MEAPLVCAETGRNAGTVPSPLLHRPPGLYHNYDSEDDDDDYDGDYDGDDDHDYDNDQGVD